MFKDECCFLMDKKQKKLKVFGYEWNRKRYIVAADSKKKASELFKVKYSYYLKYGGETGNDDEIRFAMSKPGTIFVAKNDYQNKFKEYKNGK